MLTHLSTSPQLPARTVVIGAGGFVGGTIARRLAELGGKVLSLSRGEVDLLKGDAAQRLASLLRPEDAVVAVALLLSEPVRGLSTFVTVLVPASLPIVSVT